MTTAATRRSRGTEIGYGSGSRNDVPTIRLPSQSSRAAPTRSCWRSSPSRSELPASLSATVPSGSSQQRRCRTAGGRTPSSATTPSGFLTSRRTRTSWCRLRRALPRRAARRLQLSRAARLTPLVPIRARSGRLRAGVWILGGFRRAPAPSLAPPSRAPPAAVAGRAPDAARPNPRALRRFVHLPPHTSGFGVRPAGPARINSCFIPMCRFPAPRRCPVWARAIYFNFIFFPLPQRSQGTVPLQRVAVSHVASVVGALYGLKRSPNPRLR